MLKTPFLIRLVVASVAAVVITFGIIVLVMWMNGLITEDEPSSVSYTPCVFGEKVSAPPKNPYAKDSIVLDCVPPEEVKPLFVQWFDRILSRRNPDGSRVRSSR